MAARRRARRFAIQLIYSLESKIEKKRANLKLLGLLKGNIDNHSKVRKPLFSYEVDFANWLREEARGKSVEKEAIKKILSAQQQLCLQTSVQDLWDAQLAGATFLSSSDLFTSEQFKNDTNNRKFLTLPPQKGVER